MTYHERIKDLFKSGNKKNNWNYIIILLMLVLAYVVLDYFNGNKNISNTISTAEDTEKVITSLASYEQLQKNELKYILGQMDGVGRVEVMLYFESGEEQVPAINNTTAKNQTEETDTEGGKRTTEQTNDGKTVVMQNNGSSNEPFILKINKPKLTGVMVIAEGASDEIIKYSIEKAVSKLYDIELDKVYVYPMKK